MRFLQILIGITAVFVTAVEGNADIRWMAIVDCSGCSPAEKKAAALSAVNALLCDPLIRAGLQSGVPASVTDFETRVITGYQVTFQGGTGEGGGTSKAVVPTEVSAAQKRLFADAVEVLETIEFMRSDEIPTHAPGHQHIRTAYPSAFDLLGDNGHAADKYSKALRNVPWPNAKSEALGGRTFGDVIDSTFQMLGDYLDERNVLITEVSDGTLVVVKPKLVEGTDGMSVYWNPIQSGLRRSDGSVILDAESS